MGPGRGMVYVEMEVGEMNAPLDPSFMTCFTDSCSLGPSPVQRTDIKTQDPDRRVSPGF